MILLLESDSWEVSLSLKTESRQALTWVRSCLLWQLFAYHFLGWEFCKLNSGWHHPAENYIHRRAHSYETLPFRCSEIALIWWESTGGAWALQNTFNRMTASLDLLESGELSSIATWVSTVNLGKGHGQQRVYCSLARPALYGISSL